MAWSLLMTGRMCAGTAGPTVMQEPVIAAAARYVPTSMRSGMTVHSVPLTDLGDLISMQLVPAP